MDMIRDLHRGLFLPEGYLQDIHHLIDKMEGYLFPCLFRDILDILHVPLGEDKGSDTRAMGGKDLFLDPAYGEDNPTQRYLARHGEVLLDRFTGQQRCEGRQDRHPR